ncbi:hypothetical protein BU15DRAFT_76666 [Melanogaster broomeanus]|nr:hypothetical protein BU15DRAFT_76666 [Melanogaster broomeanus]
MPIMLRAAFGCCVAVFLAQHIHAIRAAQVPLRSSHSDWQSTSFGDKDSLANWSLDEPPNPNATDHLVFETVNSLLQHWPNTRLRNGHIIVPGIIPEGTLLYHGRSSNELPPGPEWTAVDPEHSTCFCGFEFEKRCWHLTLATTRPLKVVYFDGTSAAKAVRGVIDTQDVITSVITGPHWIVREQQRLKVLCEWGEGFGVDGFDGNGFVVLCDFTAGVEVVSFVNLAASPNTGVVPDCLVASLTSFEAVHAGSWHNHFPGELRVHLDLAGLVSFYDTKLAPSLVPIRAGQDRWDHRVRNISSEDVLGARARLAEALTRPEGDSSGIDWRALIRVIVDRYADRLELLQYLLSSQATDSETILDLARKIQVQLRIMLTPYILRTASPPHPSTGTEVDWAVPIFKLCATTHTSPIQSDSPSMTPSEQLILEAIRGTSREICRVVTNMWTSGVHAGLDSMLNTQEFPDVGDVTKLMDAWSDDVNRLMAWLDWNVWVKCKPGCGPEEMCYLPTWPVGFNWDIGLPDDWMSAIHEHFGALGIERIATGHVEDLDDDDDGERLPDEVLKPQPRCIGRVQPYEW